MNDVNIIGYINSKPNMKQKDGQTTVNFLISPRHKKDTPVEFIPCIVFGKYAESVFQYIHKGDMVAVGGRLSGRYVSVLLMYQNQKKQKKRDSLQTLMKE